MLLTDITIEHSNYSLHDDLFVNEEVKLILVVVIVVVVVVLAHYGSIITRRKYK